MALRAQGYEYWKRLHDLLDGEYGLQDVCLGVPCVVGQGGARQIVAAPLLPDEKTALSKSASILQDVLKQLEE